MGTYFITGAGGFAGSFVSDVITQKIDKGNVDLNQSLTVGGVSGTVTMFIGGTLNIIGGAIGGLPDTVSKAANTVISATNEVVTDISSALFNKVHDVK